MLIDLFTTVLKHYLDAQSQTTDSTSLVHRTLIVDLPRGLTELLQRRDIVVKGSEGIGNRTKYPWVCLMNRKLTNTPQKSIYIAYLFKKDMSGFYLTLNQGITFFEKRYKKKKYDNAMRVSKYFGNEITGSIFKAGVIDLGGVRGDNGYGFERTTILSKYYDGYRMDEEELKSDLREMLKLYDEIINLLYPRTYDEAIKNILDEDSDVKIALDQAEEMIQEILGEPGRQELSIKDLLEIKPNRNKVHRLKKLSLKSDLKTDYIKQAEENARKGLLGEELVLQFEKRRMLEKGYDEIINDIQWISKQTDVYGYDIESFSIDENGKIRKIYIEVKTTNSKYDIDFYVSENERVKSIQYGNSYWLYRIFDCDSAEPKFYRVCGKIEDNFTIDPISYIASLK